MKLISTKIHDYYDSCINQYGYDVGGNIFVRDPSTISIVCCNNSDRRSGTVKSDVNAHLVFLLKSLNLGIFSSKNKDNQKWIFAPIKVLVAGKLYGVIKISPDFPVGDAENKTTHYVYSFDTLIEVATLYGLDVIDREKSIWNYYPNSYRPTQENIINHFNIIDKYVQECIEHKLVVAIVRNIHRNYI